MKKIFIISGPTASGKSSLALELASNFNLEIVNADSLQIFKGMDIGTAKPSLDEQKLVKHHLIDIVNPWDDYSNSNYQSDADNAINSINSIPIVCGGSGFYIKSLMYGIFKIPKVTPNNDFFELLKNSTKETLYAKLQSIDPETAHRFHANDTYRTNRALEVYYSTGQTMSYYREQHNETPRYDFVFIVLTPDKKLLKKNIFDRTNSMIKNGLIDEVKNLLEISPTKNVKAYKSIGYNEIITYLDQKISLEEAIEQINNNTYHLAKRQVTWFKKQNNIICIDPESAYIKIKEIFVKFKD